MNSEIKIGVLLTPQFGDMAVMRDRWVEAEQLGADAIYTADHFFATVLNEQALSAAEHAQQTDDKNFEAMSIQAAMAATTSRVEIGCLVHGNGFRNPNLLADMARTIDHLSNGRFVLGLGAGYEKRDYEEYGYHYGTATSRAQLLATNVPIIKARLQKLVPPPIGKLPLVIASMGEKIGMRVVAQYADRWHVYGHRDQVTQKTEVLKRICEEVGRDFRSLELTTFFVPQLLGADDADPDVYLRLGIRHIVSITQGPDWDFTELRQLLAWRKAQTGA